MEALRQISAIVLVFGLLGAGVWTLRRRAVPLRFRTTKSLAAVDRLSLTPQHALHLVHVAGRDLLIATHPNGFTLLTENILPLAENNNSPLIDAALHTRERA